MRLAEILSFNPPTPLPKGEKLPFIEMAALPTTGRAIPSFTRREATGSGSKFRNGDTLLARITPCLENGKGGMVRGLPGDGLGHGSTEFIVMRAYEKTEEDYVYYVSRLPEFRTFAIQQMNGTSGRQRVNWQSLQDFEVAELTNGDRCAVGLTLGALDDKVELNRRTNETLEVMARAIFTDWFSDFGPTRAKVEGRAPYLAPELWALFPDCIDDETGLPEGWRPCAAADLINFNPAERLTKGDRAPYIDMAALPTRGPNADPPVQREFSSGMKFRNGDTLFARITPCLENGKTAFVQGLSDGDVAWGSTEFIVMRSRPPVPPPFSYLLARDEEFRGHAIRSMTGTSGRQRARTEALELFPMAAPPVDRLWFAFGEVTVAAFDSIKRNAQESETLARTRDLLLPKLMSGEIRLRDAERAAGEVL